MSVTAIQRKKRWLGGATIALMIAVPLICGYVTWSQFENVATRFRWGRFDLFGAIRVLLSIATTLCAAWLFWGSLILVQWKRWKKSRHRKKKADPVVTDNSGADLRRSEKNEKKAKFALLLLVGLPCFTLIAWHLLIPRYSSSYIDLSSGRIKHVRYFLTHIPVGVKYEDTILSRGFKGSVTPRWICFGEDTPRTGDAYSMNLFGIHDMEAYMDFDPQALAMVREDILEIWKDIDSNYGVDTSSLLKHGKIIGDSPKVFIDAEVVSKVRADQMKTTESRTMRYRQ